jgi:hypothetical protein
MKTKPKSSRVTVFLDWLRFTVPVDIENSELLPPINTFQPTGEINTPFPNYNSTIALGAGRIDWHTERPEQRKLVTLTGDDLLQMRREGYTDLALLRWVDAFENLNVPRLDIAIDTRNRSVVPHLLYKAFLAGKLVTKARKVTRVHETTASGVNGGYTVYIGSRFSEQFMRIYDKRAEQLARGKDVLLPDEEWTRVELELKGDKARVVLRALAASDNGQYDAAGAIFGDFLAWPDNPVWCDLVAGDITADLSVGRRETDHETWLRKIVFPAFERAIREKNPRARALVEEVARRQGWTPATI